MSLFARTTAVISILAAADLSGKEGHFYKLNEDGNAILCASVADDPHGLILESAPQGGQISAAPLGGNHGTVLIKLGGVVDDLRVDLVLRADATAEADPGVDGCVIVARPLETGVAGEKIEAVLLPARRRAAAIEAASTDGTAADAAANLSGLAAETEKIGDDLRALIDSLQAAGILG